VTVTLATAGRSGAVVQSVAPGASQLRPADVITAVDGEPVETLTDLTDVVEADREIGESFRITVYRGSHHFPLEEVASSPVFLGIEVRDPQKGEKGLTVVAVAPGSPAAASGIEKGDVIESIDGQGLASGDELVNAIAAHDAGDEVTLTVARGSGTDEVQVTVADRSESG